MAQVQTDCPVLAKLIEESASRSGLRFAIEAMNHGQGFATRLVRKGFQSGHFTGRPAWHQQVTALFTDIYDFSFY
jgi:hypothetical protein